MADVTVDERPMAKLPYDPDTIPPAVRKRAAAVDALYNNKPATPAPEPAARQGEAQTLPTVVEQPSVDPPEASASQLPQAQEAQPPEPSTPATPAPAAPSSPPTPEDENSQTWKDRYFGLQGRYASSQKLIGEQEEIMRQMGREVLQARAAPPRHQAPPPLPPQDYITEQDVQNYGSELIDLTQRAAAQVVAPQLQRIEEENARLREQLAREARRGLDQQVELAVPNYREIDRNPRWHDWLLGIDVFSGRVRQQLLNEAISSASAPRVISFFKGFLQEEVATGHREPAPSSMATLAREPAVPLVALATPGRARPATGGDTAVPSNKPTYTRAEIARLYDQQRRGAYAGREAEWARQEADIIAAPLEGRVRG